MDAITVIKLNPKGEETWRYSGKILESGPHHLVLEAFFDRPDSLFHGMPLHIGDRFVETYYTDRWYNIFQIHAREDGSLRGWYCNVAHPANIDGDRLTYVDLALDLLVFPDGRQMILDEDEFTLLEISPDARQQALAALKELQSRFDSLLTGSEQTSPGAAFVL